MTTRREVVKDWICGRNELDVEACVDRLSELNRHDLNSFEFILDVYVDVRTKIRSKRSTLMDDIDRDLMGERAYELFVTYMTSSGMILSRANHRELVQFMYSYVWIREKSVWYDTLDLILIHLRESNVDELRSVLDTNYLIVHAMKLMYGYEKWAGVDGVCRPPMPEEVETLFTYLVVKCGIPINVACEDLGKKRYSSPLLMMMNYCTNGYGERMGDDNEYFDVVLARVLVRLGAGEFDPDYLLDTDNEDDNYYKVDDEHETITSLNALSKDIDSVYAVVDLHQMHMKIHRRLLTACLESDEFSARYLKIHKQRFNDSLAWISLNPETGAEAVALADDIFNN